MLICEQRKLFISDRHCNSKGDNLHKLLNAIFLEYYGIQVYLECCLPYSHGMKRPVDVLQ